MATTFYATEFWSEHLKWKGMLEIRIVFKIAYNIQRLVLKPLANGWYIILLEWNDKIVQ